MKTPTLAAHRHILAGLAMLVSAATTQAALFLVPEASLTAPTLNPSSIVLFDEVANGTAVNGLTIKGFTFLENSPAAVTNIGGGPVSTNHIDGSMALQVGAFDPATYVLTIELPALSSSFGFGFALLGTQPGPDVLTVTLFDGLTNVGSLGIAGVADPNFAGGFAAVGSTVAFDRAEIRFAPTAASFALDNVAAVNALAVPEPGTALAGMMLAGMVGLRRRRKG